MWPHILLRVLRVNKLLGSNKGNWPVDERAFWKLIDKGLGAAVISHRLKRSIGALSKLVGDDIVAFFEVFICLHENAKLRPLLGSSILINKGCDSDDRFDNFRTFLILSGERVYRSGIDFPDSLAGSVGFLNFDVGAYYSHDFKGVLMAAHSNATNRYTFYDDAAFFTDDRFIENFCIKDWDGFSTEELRSSYPHLWSFFGGYIESGVECADRGIYKKDAAFVPGMGMLHKGDIINHKKFGKGVIKEFELFPNIEPRADVFFKDRFRYLTFDNVDLFLR